MAQARDFMGAWRLVSFSTRDEEGKEDYPFGRKASGMIYYDGESHMGVTIMAGERRRFKSGDMFSSTLLEKDEAMRFIGYSGTYEIKEDAVIHRIDVSFFPNWVGDSQERYYKFNGNKLILTTPPMLQGGRKAVSELVWEKL